MTPKGEGLGEELRTEQLRSLRFADFERVRHFRKWVRTEVPSKYRRGKARWRPPPFESGGKKALRRGRARVPRAPKPAPGARPPPSARGFPFRRFGRFLPYIGWGLAAWEIYEWMQPGSPIIAGLPGWETPAGWIKCPTPSCDFPPSYFQWSAAIACAPQAQCPAGQGMTSIGSTADTWENYFQHPTRRLLTIGQHTSGVIGTAGARYRLVAAFLRPADPTPEVQPKYKVGVVVLPDEFTDPYEDMSPEPEKYYEAETGTIGERGGLRLGRVQPNPGPWPGPTPIPPPPGPPPTPGALPMEESEPGKRKTRRGWHVPKPPKPGEKEKKEKINYGIPGKAYGGLTEIGDAMDCMAEALGIKLKGTMQQKAKQIWDALKERPMDQFAFAKCMALANISDAIIGKLRREASRRQNNSRYFSPRPRGYRGGGWGTRMH